MYRLSYRSRFGGPPSPPSLASRNYFAQRRRELPDPLAREVILGLASRYFEKHARSSMAVWFHELLFGYPTDEFDPRFPGGLSHFCTLMGRGWNPLQLVENHTLWPLFRIFESSATRRTYCENLFLQSRPPGPRLRGRFQFVPSRSKHFRPRFCLLCLCESAQAGQPLTWLRDHQIPGADWCPRHKVRLCGADDQYINDRFRTHSGRSFSLPRLTDGDMNSLTTFENVSSKLVPYLIKPKSRDADAELNFSAIAIGLLDEHLSGIEHSLWAELVLCILDEHGTGRSWDHLKKWKPTTLWRRYGMGKLLLKSKWYGNSAALTKMIRGMNRSQKLCLVSAFFGTARQFVEKLISIHQDRLVVNVDSLKRTATSIPLPEARGE